MMSEPRFQTALVTGANRGIGFSISKGLANMGVEVLMGCRDPLAGEQALVRLRETVPQANVSLVHLDLEEADGLHEQLFQISNQHNPIDILVNNAAVLMEGDFFNLAQYDFYKSMQINAMSVFDLIQFFGKSMKKRNHGRIVNISSGWGSFEEGLTGPVGYSISKASLNAITKAAAQAFSSYPNIKVNAMSWLGENPNGRDER